MDAFEYDGAWWDPNEPEKEWTGTLRFDPTEGARVTVLVPTAKPEFFPTLREYDVLLGVTTTGKAVTLFRCFDRTTRGTLYRVPRRIDIFANSLIVGFHCDAVDPLMSTASVSFRNLEAWWGRSAIGASVTADVHVDKVVDRPDGFLPASPSLLTVRSYTAQLSVKRRPARPVYAPKGAEAPFEAVPIVSRRSCPS